MLVPVFAMYYKHRCNNSRFNSNLATIQARRRDEAIRVLQLAQESPERLTRAERAAINGKIAWRKSVASWQVAKRDGSIDSSSWSAPGSGEIPSPKRETASMNSLDSRRNLELAIPTTPPLPPFRDDERAVDATTFTQCRKTETIPLQNLASSHGLAAAAGVKDMGTVLRGNENPATHLPSAAEPRRPSIVTSGTCQSQDAASYFPERKKLTPTMLYGFHLPRPQAGQAYSMTGTENAEDRLSSREATMPMRQLPPGLEIESIASFEPPTAAPTQFAVRSPSSPMGVSNTVPVQTIMPHILQPLKRRSAQTRRASSSSIEASTSRPAAKRSKSGQGTWSPSSSSDDLQVLVNGAEIGPKWHRERMRRLHSGAIVHDLLETNGEIHDG